MRYKKLLLFVAFSGFVLGDSLTTYIGYNHLPYVYEQNGIVEPILEYGLVGLMGYKALLFGIIYEVYRYVNEPYDYTLIGTIAVMGIAITLWNIRVIAMAL